MRKLFEEYGWLTISVIIVTLLIAIASPVGASVKNSITGLITKFANTTNNVADVMGDDIANLNGELSGGSGGGDAGGTTYLSLDDKFVGYYADTNDDGEADGVIFFDYAHGATTDAGYLGTGVAVTAKTAGLANYKLVGDNIVQKVGSGDDRFYVISLENTKPTSGDNTAYWYNSLYGSADTSKTSTAFGTGKTNTATMKAIWDAGTPEQNTRDMFSNIPSGWFVPSKDEWSVLGSELKKVAGTSSYSAITTNAGATLSFGDYYWSSSLRGSGTAWHAYFKYSCMLNVSLNDGYFVRVASTF